MKVLGLYNNSGPKYHRILLPMALMDGIDGQIIPNITNVSQLDGYDIVFFNRLVHGVLPADLLAAKKKYGFALICDLDDHWELDKEHFLKPGYDQAGVTERILDYMAVCDGFIVTHERLQAEVAEFIRQRGIDATVFVAPNAIPKWGQFNVEKVKDDWTRLFWAGSITHKRDIELLAPTFKKIDRSRVKFVIGGYTDSNQAEAMEWGEMVRIFTNEGRWRHQVLRSEPVQSYFKLYQACDIALVPLVDNQFNRHKSNLKILEAAAIKAPVVVSRVHPYLGFPETVVNYVDMHRTWYYHISRLVSDPVLAKEQGEALFEYCREHYNFERINKQRHEYFDETIQRCKAGKV